MNTTWPLFAETYDHAEPERCRLVWMAESGSAGGDDYRHALTLYDHYATVGRLLDDPSYPCTTDPWAWMRRWQSPEVDRWGAMRAR